MGKPAIESSSGGARAIGSIGTLARVAVGLASLALAVVTGLAWWGVVLGIAGFPALLVGAQLLWRRWSPDQVRATGPVGFSVNLLVLTALLVIDRTRSAALLWLGASMLLAAWRGYAGCESLAISNWLLRRDDQVGCVIFSPVDALEAHRSEGA